MCHLRAGVCVWGGGGLASGSPRAAAYLFCVIYMWPSSSGAAVRRAVSDEVKGAVEEETGPAA